MCRGGRSHGWRPGPPRGAGKHRGALAALIHRGCYSHLVPQGPGWEVSCSAPGSPSRKECPPHSPKSTPLRNAELDTLVFTLRLLMLEGGPRGCRGPWGWVGRGRGGSRVGTIPEQIPSDCLDEAHVCEGPCRCSESEFRSAPGPCALWTTAAASPWVSLLPVGHLCSSGHHSYPPQTQIGWCHPPCSNAPFPGHGSQTDPSCTAQLRAPRWWGFSG